MSQKKKQNEIPAWALNGHRKPITRREMLAAGVIPFAGALFAPKWLQILLSNPAHAIDASECPTGSNFLPAFVHIHLSGGNAAFANWVPGDQGGSPLNSYSKLGMGTAPTFSMEMGGARFYTASGFLTGLKATAGTSINNTSFAGIAVTSGDDRDSNPFGMNGLLNAAGLNGQILPNLGERNNATGGAHVPAGIAPAAPLNVTSLDAVSASIGYSGALAANLTGAQQASISKVIRNLSSSQTQKLLTTIPAKGKEVRDLIDCAGIKVEGLTGNPSGAGIDPRADANFRTIWGIAANSGVATVPVRQAAMVYNALRGNAGMAVMTLGGYDYHGQARTATDAMDTSAGRLIGQVLASAQALNKKCFIYVTTDGSVSAPDSATAGTGFTGDFPSTSCSYMMFYDPNGRRPSAKGTQLGWFTNGGQVVDTNALNGLGGNPERATIAAFANYLQCAGINPDFATNPTVKGGINVDGTASADTTMFTSVSGVFNATTLRDVVKLNRT